MSKRKKTKIQKPEPRSVFAFTKHRRGDFLLFVEEKDDTLIFMHLPDRYKVVLTPEEYTEGVVTKLLDFVEQIPREVHEVAAANMENVQSIS